MGRVVSTLYPYLAESCLELIDLEQSIPQKQCTKCGNCYPATPDFFSRDKNKSDGLFSWCKVCKSADDREYRSNPAAREREFNRKRSPEYREYNRNHARLERQDPIKNQRIKESKSSPRSRELERERKKVLRKKPRYLLLHNINARNRRARLKSLEAQLTEDDWLKCLEYFDYRCAVCGKQKGLWHTIAADHWIPLSCKECPGTIPTNIVPLCHGVGGCNNRKGDKLPEEWLFSHLTQSKAQNVLDRIRGYFQWLTS